MRRRSAILFLAIIAATGWLVVPGAGVAEVRAATPDLTVVTTARYDVQPEAHRVRVTLDMTLTNRLSDTRTKRYYFDHALLSVLPDVSGLKASWAGSGTPRARVSKRSATYTLVRIDLAQRLYSHKSAAVRLVFDLVDKGGAAGRTVRIGPSLVSFPVWAYATDSTSGSTVRVVFPAGYNVEVHSGAIPSPRTDPSGKIVFQTPKLSKPLAFFAFLVADRPGSYGEQTVHAKVGDEPVDLTIRGWVDDTAWTARVGGLVGRALPLLSERIGLPWPRDGGLIVHETITRSTGGYAGLFDPAAGQIEVAYDAGDEVVLHEAAHTWFNGGLLADRWANEAFASYYGLEAASTLKIKVKPGAGTLTPTLEAARIPLNAWGAVGDEDRATEDYGYAASLALARAIAERAGPDGLRAVWADAAAGVGAYQPPVTGSGATSAVGATTAAPETVEGAPDWRGLLDLLDEHGATSYDDLWRTWVARDEDLALLDARALARTKYDAVIAAAGDWQIPRAARDAMRAWRFDDARRLLTAAATILDQRGTIASEAAAAGLTLPATLRTAFESPDGFASASLEATAQLEAIARYEAAVAARPAGTDTFQDIGLWGSAPQAELDRARTLFATGDLAGAAAAAGGAATTWSTAGDIGRGRIISVVVLVVALLLGLALLAVWLRGRRRAGPQAVADAGVAATATAATATADHRHGRHRPHSCADRVGACRYRLDLRRRPGPLRYTRRHPGPGRGHRGRGARRERSRTGLMGLTRSRPSHEILSGDSADVYFARAESILEQEGRDPLVTMEVFTREAAVLCGIDEARNLLGHVLAAADPAETRLEALEDGDEIGPKEIVLRIRARYRRFGLYETAFLGMLAQSTGWATAAQACVEAAAPEPVISFGARHIHPDITDVLDYAAIVGGCVGASTPAGARLAGLAPTGTMPHSLVLIFGDTVEAALAFDRHVPSDVPRIVLIDTFKDEAEEALRVANALGDRLFGVRLDTPSERGRVTADLVHEVRARLDQAGFHHVRITVSGGLTPDRIRYFKEAGAPVDSYAVGSYISGATPIDFTGDIKEIEGVPIAKRGRIPGLTDSPRLKPVDLAAYREG